MFSLYTTSTVVNLNEISHMYAVGDIEDPEMESTQLMSPFVPEDDFYDVPLFQTIPLPNDVAPQWMNEELTTTPYRSILPVPAPHVEISVWSILKDSIGKYLFNFSGYSCHLHEYIRIGQTTLLIIIIDSAP